MIAASYVFDVAWQLARQSGSHLDPYLSSPYFLDSNSLRLEDMVQRSLVSANASCRDRVGTRYSEILELKETHSSEVNRSDHVRRSKV